MIHFVIEGVLGLLLTLKILQLDKKIKDIESDLFNFKGTIQKCVRFGEDLIQRLDFPYVFNAYEGYTPNFYADMQRIATIERRINNLGEEFKGLDGNYCASKNNITNRINALEHYLNLEYKTECTEKLPKYIKKSTKL